MAELSRITEYTLATIVWLLWTAIEPVTGLLVGMCELGVLWSTGRTTTGADRRNQ